MTTNTITRFATANKNSIVVIVTTLLCALAIPSTKADITVSGGNVVDSSTGLSWRLFTATAGDSLDFVNSHLATTFAGYQVATAAQVLQLVSDATGVSPLADASRQFPDRSLSTLITQLTPSYSDGNGEYVDGVVSDISGGNQRVIELRGYDPAFGGNGANDRIITTKTEASSAASDSGETSGVYLVLSAVPEPSSVAMMVIGVSAMGGLIALRRRRA